MIDNDTLRTKYMHLLTSRMSSRICSDLSYRTSEDVANSSKGPGSPLQSLPSSKPPGERDPDTAANFRQFQAPRCLQAPVQLWLGVHRH